MKIDKYTKQKSKEAKSEESETWSEQRGRRVNKQML